MSQFKVVFLSEHGDLRSFVITWAYQCGEKLREHWSIDSPLVRAIEFLLSPQGIFYKSRLVWAGDDALPELEGVNFYHIGDMYVNQYKRYYQRLPADLPEYRYIVNHTKRRYVDKLDSGIHPLPLLTYESETIEYDGQGKDLCSTWARDIISMENFVPEHYEKLEFTPSA